MDQIKSALEISLENEALEVYESNCSVEQSRRRKAGYNLARLEREELAQKLEAEKRSNQFFVSYLDGNIRIIHMKKGKKEIIFSAKIGTVSPSLLLAKIEAF